MAQNVYEIKAMENTADTWAVKVDKKEIPHCKPKKPISGINCCPNKKARRKSSRKKSCCRKKRSLSLASIGQDMSTHCCQCCCLLAAYIRETGKLFCACIGDSKKETEVCERLFALLQSMSNLTVDIYRLLKKVVRFMIAIKK